MSEGSTEIWGDSAPVIARSEFLWPPTAIASASGAVEAKPTYLKYEKSRQLPAADGVNYAEVDGRTFFRVYDLVDLFLDKGAAARRVAEEIVEAIYERLDGKLQLHANTAHLQKRPRKADPLVPSPYWSVTVAGHYWPDELKEEIITLLTNPDFQAEMTKRLEKRAAIIFNVNQKRERERLQSLIASKMTTVGGIKIEPTLSETASRLTGVLTLPSAGPQPVPPQRERVVELLASNAAALREFTSQSRDQSAKLDEVIHQVAKLRVEVRDLTKRFPLTAVETVMNQPNIDLEALEKAISSRLDQTGPTAFDHMTPKRGFLRSLFGR